MLRLTTRKITTPGLVAIICQSCISPVAAQQGQGLEPISERVDVQAGIARPEQIVDGEWVAVGTSAKRAIVRDHSRLYDGRPSHRFRLREDDNTLTGYAKGSTKGRAELSYAFTTAEHVKNLNAREIRRKMQVRNLYHYGKGVSEQGARMHYRFAIRVPSDISPDTKAIFAQWHGVPERTLVSTPDGEERKLSDKEFLDLRKTMTFRNDIGYENGKPNGWKVEQGGYPPLAFGFTDGYFYIKANSDKKRLSDKTERTNSNPLKHAAMTPRRSQYKTSTIVYKESIGRFPKDRWVDFEVSVQWSKYDMTSDNIVATGRLTVMMVTDNGSNGKIERTLVDNVPVEIGRNDTQGYYFKYGIYRSGSTVPVEWHLAGYREGMDENAVFGRVR